MERNKDLPERWIHTSLVDITKKITDGEHLKPKFIETGMPFVSAKDITESRVSFENVKYVSNSDGKQFRKKCDPTLNDILMVSRGNVGKTCLVKTEKIFCLLGSVILLKIIKNIEPKYVLYFLKSQFTLNDLIKISSSTVQGAIYLRDIKNLNIPLAPLNEQKRIVKKIEKILSVLKFIKKNIKVILNQLEQYQESFLIQKFQPWLEKEEFNLKLDDLTISRKIGLVRARNVQCKIGTPYLKMNNITLGGKLDLHNIVNVNVDSKELNNFILKKGDILFNTRNSYELVGKTSVWNDEIPNCVYNNNIMQIRVKNILEPKFLSYFMNTRNFKNNLLEIKRATTNICAIYDKDLKKQKIPVPPLNEQKKIIKEIKLNISLIENQKESMRSVLDKINIIQSSILKQAFEGKLVPQDPNDEPASELLKRIKLEK